MFERFTEDARHVVTGAMEHATRLRHDYIGCEHFLMALAAGDDEVGEVLRERGVTVERVETTILGQIGRGRGLFDRLDREALAAVGIDVDAVRQAVEQSFGLGALDRPQVCQRTGPRFLPWRRARHNPMHLPLTPRAKHCLGDALKVATHRHSGHIGSEHIAESVLAMRSSAAKNILAALGVPVDAIRADIAERYRQAS